MVCDLPSMMLPVALPLDVMTRCCGAFCDSLTRIMRRLSIFSSRELHTSLEYFCNSSEKFKINHQRQYYESIISNGFFLTQNSPRTRRASLFFSNLKAATFVCFVLRFPNFEPAKKFVIFMLREKHSQSREMCNVVL